MCRCRTAKSFASCQLDALSSERALKRGLGHPIRAKVFDIMDGKEPGQVLPSTVHAALDRANRNPTDGRGVLIGQPLGHDQKQGFTMLGRKPRERSEHVLDITLGILIGRCPEASSEEPVRVLDLASLLPVLAIEAVAQDREQPCL